MTASKIYRIALCVCALVVLPSVAAAQAPTVSIVPFEATFANPCTAEDVAVTANSTISVSDSLTAQGERRISVSVVTKGSGVGAQSGIQYPFSENQQFTVKAPLIGEAFDSTFSDKISMKGPGSIDNWVMRVYLRLRINEAGQVVISVDRTTADVCKG